MKESKADVPYGTLDLLVLQTLHTMGEIHGFGIARRIEELSAGTLELNQGSIYPALLRLQQRGLIESHWGVSENNRRAKFYGLTGAGARQLDVEVENWARTVELVQRMLEAGR
jgi:transcriptional regulator